MFKRSLADLQPLFFFAIRTLTTYRNFRYDKGEEGSDFGCGKMCGRQRDCMADGKYLKCQKNRSNKPMSGAGSPKTENKPPGGGRGGAYIFQSPFLRGLVLRFESLIVGSKFTFFALFYYLRAIFQVQAPGGLYRTFNLEFIDIMLSALTLLQKP